MGSNTKILIFKAKELIYTIIFVVFGILLLLLLLIMFLPGDSSNEIPEVTQTDAYIPGVYTSTAQLGDSTLEVQVTVDSDRICDVAIVNLNETVTAMYPLLTPDTGDQKRIGNSHRAGIILFKNKLLIFMRSLFFAACYRFSTTSPCFL